MRRKYKIQMQNSDLITIDADRVKIDRETLIFLSQDRDAGFETPVSAFAHGSWVWFEEVDDASR